MKLDNVKIMYTGGVKGGRGWIGDVKNMYLDIKKLIALGWNPKYTSEEAIRLEIRSLMNQ